MGDLSAWFDSTGFMPHGHCYLWTPLLLWTNVLSDSVIAASYFSIAIGLWVFVQRRGDLPFRAIFVLFGVFVMACGVTHIFDVITIWQPEYWAAAFAKVLTAVASLGTAILFWPLLPRAVALPSPALLREQNRLLQAEVARRCQVEEELRAANLALHQRGVQLEAANRELEAFSAAASHDLRAPLRHIDGYARMLMAEAKGLAPAHAGLLNSITLAARKMDYLIEALLALSRNSAAKPLDETVDLNAVVEEARSAQDAARAAGPARTGEPFRAGDPLRTADSLRAGAALRAGATRRGGGSLRAGDPAVEPGGDSAGDTAGGPAGDLLRAGGPAGASGVAVSPAADPASPSHDPASGRSPIDWRIGPLPAVRGNRALLLIALNNLLSNAVKFSAKRAHPVIRVEVHDSSAERIEISVTDNGAGFDPAYQDKLFGMFQRLHSQEEFEGTGIGLATVRRIVERHGGRIRANATLGEGAVFTFTLPRAP